jgi:ribosomal protein S18 acetylase RimI-like enzyme
MQPGPALVLRPMRSADLPAVVDLWVASWRHAYPEIDFEARRPWMIERLAEHERDGAQCLLALDGDAIVGLLVLNSATRYLDQIAVDHRRQGEGIADALFAEARRLAPSGFELHVNQDNARAVRFYEKQGLRIAGTDVNPRSGAPIYKMRWTPPLRIRDAVRADADEICTVLRRSIIELCAADHHNDPAILARWLANKTPKIVADWIEQPDNSLLVAVEYDTIVAAGSVTDQGEIQLNYVLPEARFRGASRMLLRALEQRTFEHGNTRCHLLSTETAHRFYRSAGYIDDGAPQRKFGTTSSYPMSKRLAADAASASRS